MVGPPSFLMTARGGFFIFTKEDVMTAGAQQILAGVILVTALVAFFIFTYMLNKKMRK